MSRKDPRSAGGADEAGLEPRQIAALEALLGGKTASEAAREADVDRRTLYRWQQTDSAFQAALTRARREAREATMARLERLAESATSSVEQAVDQGDVRTAMAVLRGLGLLDGTPPNFGPDNPAEVARESERDRLRKELSDGMLF